MARLYVVYRPEVFEIAEEWGFASAWVEEEVDDWEKHCICETANTLRIVL